MQPSPWAKKFRATRRRRAGCGCPLTQRVRVGDRGSRISIRLATAVCRSAITGTG